MTYASLITWALLGVVGLLFQATMLFKDTIAAYQPTLQPALVQWCVWANCQILPLQQTDAVVIDHAAIDQLHPRPNPDDADSSPQWSFEIHLRNSAKVPVATPWIELTLTDAQDQPVVRKVMHLTEWGAPTVMTPGEIWSLSSQLSLSSSDSHFMGYRMLTFYP